MNWIILHCDLDCFFAAVEERDNPELMYINIAKEYPGILLSYLILCNFILKIGMTLDKERYLRNIMKNNI